MSGNEVKKPQAGEWWEMEGKGLVYVVGLDTDGDPVFTYDEGDGIDMNYESHFLKNSKHLPDCTGWDWVPEVWPKYYVPTTVIITYYSDSPVAYFRRDREHFHGETNGETFLIDGTSFTWKVWIQQDNVQEVTETEAKARIKPAESPDDWVIQDRVPARKGIDERAWDDGRPLKWSDAGAICGWTPMPMHGQKGPTGSILRLRCRRKDLPPLSPEKTKPPEPPKPVPATRTIILKQWIASNGPGTEREIWHASTPNVIGSLYETGQTKEVEIPITPK